MQVCALFGLSSTLVVSALAAPLPLVMAPLPREMATGAPIVAHVLDEQTTSYGQSPPHPPLLPDTVQAGPDSRVAHVYSLNRSAAAVKRKITKHVLWESSPVPIKREAKRNGYTTLDVREAVRNSHPISPKMWSASL